MKVTISEKWRELLKDTPKSVIEIGQSFLDKTQKGLEEEYDGVVKKAEIDFYYNDLKSYCFKILIKGKRQITLEYLISENGEFIAEKVVNFVSVFTRNDMK